MARPRGTYWDPRHKEYQLQHQTDFAGLHKALGPYGTWHNQRVISRWRVMRRKLMAGGNPSRGDFREVPAVRPGFFTYRRSIARLRRALDRGETLRALARRGFFGSLRDYYRPPLRRA